MAEDLIDVIDHVNPVINVSIGAWTNDVGVTFAQVKGDEGEPGEKGDVGKSIYQIWLDLGNTGTEADFLVSITQRRKRRCWRPLLVLAE